MVSSILLLFSQSISAECAENNSFPGLKDGILGPVRYFYRIFGVLDPCDKNSKRLRLDMILCGENRKICYLSHPLLAEFKIVLNYSFNCPI